MTQRHPLTSDWRVAAPECTPLGRAEVHLWAWDLEAPRERQNELLVLLSKDELLRNAKFRFERDRQANLIARGTVRRILGSYLCIAPDEIRFDYSPYGRPSVAASDDRAGMPSLEFNMSHTRTLAVAAMAWDIRLGVDVEDAQPIELDVAQAVFSSRELEALDSLAPADVVGGFYRCWTRKEAISKAEGLGLNMDMKSFSVSLGPEDRPRILDTGGVLSCEWLLQDIPVITGVVGAFAISELPNRVRCYRLK